MAGALSLDRSYAMVIALSYYTPYVSGLTNVARDVAEFLTQSGLSVAVVTSRHDRNLPRREIVNGVHVFREPVRARLDRAVISPGFVGSAIRLGRRAEMLNLHLPLPEAGMIAARCTGTPIAVTYQCDPPRGLGVKQEVIRRLMDVSSITAINRADSVIASSLDYASHSRVLGRIGRERLLAVPPPTMPHLNGLSRFRGSGGNHVGFMGRLTSEKGIDVLIAGFQQQAGPDDRLLIAGEGRSVAGKTSLDDALRLAASDSRIRFLGHVPDDQVADFYASIDVLAFPSVNSFEAFGIVQVEALLSGVPVIASDLPGVRMPVRLTNGGILVPPGDASALARALKTLGDRGVDPSELRTASANAYPRADSFDPYLRLHKRLGRRSAAA